jgi:macroglobulin-like protein
MRIMVFGHNSNLTIGKVTFHVQTEDRGEAHALIDTTVYFQGRVLHRRTNNYFDLLPLNDDNEQALKLRLDEQHRTVMDEIRSGAMQLATPAAAVAPRSAEKPAPAHAGPAQQASEPGRLLLELANAKSWLTGKHAKLQVSVREQDGNPVPGAEVRVEIEGSENGSARIAQTGSQGQAQIEFDMPRITGTEAALVIHAQHHGAKAQLRFALRAKPRVA